MILLWEGFPPALAWSDEHRLHNTASVMLRDFEPYKIGKKLKDGRHKKFDSFNDAPWGYS